MKSFQSKKLFNSETLGERLRLVREHWEWSLQDVAAKLQIDEQYVMALECGDYHTIPGEIYIKSMLKRYAELLHVNIAHVFELYERERGVLKVVHRPAGSHFRMPRVFVTPTRIRMGFVALLLLGVFTYLGVEVQQMMRAPELIVTSPGSDIVMATSVVTVAGQTETDARVFVNGEEVIGDQAGSFSEDVTLQPGVNVIEIKAQKKRGKPTVHYQRVRVEVEAMGAMAGDAVSAR